MLAPADSSWTLPEAAHLLNRAGFGGSPADIARFHALGRIKAVESLLAPDEPAAAFPLPAWASAEQAQADQRERFKQRQEMQRSLRNATPEEAARIRREANQQAQQESRQQGLEAQAWWFRRMLKTRAPLREKMTLFWHDHFATSIQKVRQAVLMVWQNELFRTHACGNFKALTQAVLLDPAMMLYLDTDSSRKGRPNENFAREVMELFTLGEGQYTEQDIREAARACTGYQLNRFTGKVEHNPRQWDESPKTVLGKTGPFTGADVINIIFEQPAAARLVPSKLWEYFAAENPAPALVDALAASFRQANFEVAPLLREIFLSREFYAPPVIRNQIKSPIQFLVQLLKQLEISEPPAGFPILAQQQLGQTLFLPPNVAGWDWGKAWINTNTLLTRYNLAGQLTNTAEMAAPGRLGGQGGQGKGAGRGVGRAARQLNRNWRGPDFKALAPPALRANPEALVDALLLRFFQGPIAKNHRAAFIEFATAQQQGGFGDAEVGELCHLMLSTPEYQLC
jgi:uncharacterized protein (DUF1800 family)